MRFRVLLLLLMLGVPAAAQAADCEGRPDALGVSRVLVVDPNEHPRIGTMQYRETLPLDDHEVVLTFDDGPLPPYTNRVLETLAAQCVKATYFLIGRMANAYPEMVRKIYEAGHTVGTHTQNHPYTFNRMGPEKAHEELDHGIASVTQALGDASELAPFFRIPGLIRADVIEKYMAQRGIMIWSTDFLADDWRHLSAAEVMRRALSRLEAHDHRGVLLLHDIQPATAMMLPLLLRELKKRGYRIVHVVPASPDRAKTPTTPSQWLVDGAHVAATGPWPVVGLDVEPGSAEPALPAPSPQNFGIADLAGSNLVVAGPTLQPRPRLARGRVPLPPQSLWPREIIPATGVVDGGLPAPSPASFGYDAEITIGGQIAPPATRAPGPRAELTGSISAQAGPDRRTRGIP